MTDAADNDNNPHTYGEVGLSDLLQVLNILDPSEIDTKFHWALELLDLHRAVSSSVDNPLDERELLEGTPSPELRGEGANPSGTIPPTEPEPTTPSAPSETIDDTPVFPYHMVHKYRVDSDLTEPRWLTQAAILPPASLPPASRKLPLEPLLHPRWSRAILSLALSTRQQDGALDIDYLIRQIVSGQPLAHMPKQPLRTLRVGIQLLLDRGPGLMPFARDQEYLLEHIMEVVGADRVQQLRFADSPLRGSGPGSRFSWDHYTPPLPGTPVVLLTDLGIAARRDLTMGASEDEWLAFAARVRAANCPLLAIIPYVNQRRWPLRLRRVMTIIAWDRSTTITKVRDSIRRR